MSRKEEEKKDSYRVMPVMAKDCRIKYMSWNCRSWGSLRIWSDRRRAAIEKTARYKTTRAKYILTSSKFLRWKRIIKKSNNLWTTLNLLSQP